MYDNDILLNSTEQSIIIAGSNDMNITTGENSMNITVSEPTISVVMADRGVKGLDGRDYYIQEEQPETNQQTYMWWQTFDNGDLMLWIEDGK